MSQYDLQLFYVAYSSGIQSTETPVYILGAQGWMLCYVVSVLCPYQRGAGGGHPILGIEHLNILNPQDPWGIENIVSYFTYFRAREKCTILIFICMEMGLVRYNVTRPRLSVLI